MWWAEIFCTIQCEENVTKFRVPIDKKIYFLTGSLYKYKQSHILGSSRRK